MSITKNPAKNFKRAKRLAQKQSALAAKPKSNNVEKAINLAGREKKLIDITNYHCTKGKAKSTTVRATQKRRLGHRELI
ncbi:hypothetical protein [Rodentibacter haemolyticus]|uniref:Uncharacterized protein n=1 Tax=Rodentibacter haemolyticus TaxID=2778911 RepID=A0ABX6UWA6_9PAST|nr:hypothetical protein [Rodentibacter haemolyticus]QPB42193.1 hypothetical protein IHV77_09795 [Rodentibacter haemolyticus]